ncbi:MAG: DinB family protein [Thermomicrobiales bacterium]
MSDVITATELRQWDADAQRLTDLVLATPASDLDQVVAGEWSARQVLAHLLDAEIVYGARLRAVVANPGSTIALFDQDAQATEIPYRDVPIEAVAAAFLSLRRVNTAVALALPASAWKRTVEHPERGTQTLGVIARVFGEHVADHLPELEGAAHARG